MWTTAKLSASYYWHRSNLWKKWDQVTQDEADAPGQVAIVTGSNCGLGKQVAFELATRGANVIMACRDLKKAEEAKSDILSKCPDAKLDVEYLDLSDLATVREFVERIKWKYSKIDILVNNAGLFTDVVTKTKDGFETSMGVNHLGHFLLTLLLVDLMKRKDDTERKSRVVWVSSSMQTYANLDLDDINLERTRSLGFCSFIPYANSKLANALSSREMGKKRLQSLGINSYALCPGLVRTEVFRNENPLRKMVSDICLYLGGHSARRGAKTIIYCALGKSLEYESGQFYRFLENWDPDLGSYNDEFTERFWDECEKLCGVSGFSKQYCKSIGHE